MFTKRGLTSHIRVMHKCAAGTCYLLRNHVGQLFQEGIRL